MSNVEIDDSNPWADEEGVCEICGGWCDPFDCELEEGDDD